MAEITISPATEADIAALAEIEFNALRLDLISHFLLKNPYDEESNRALIKWGIKQGFEPDNHLIKAVAQVPNGENGTTEKILGFCWYVKKLDGKIEPWKEAEERKKEAREKGSLENDLDGTNDEMLDRMMVPLRKHYMNALQGVPHMYIRAVYVDPRSQSGGIGTKLLQSVISDSEGHAIYLNALPLARHLYEKLGWETLAVSEMDLAQFAKTSHMGYGVYRHSCMIRKGTESPAKALSPGAVEEAVQVEEEVKGSGILSGI